MIWLILGIALMAVLGLLAVVGGADTRDGQDWATHRHI